MVNRYTHGDKCGGEYNCYAVLDKEGDFVCYDDYKQLQAENAKLQEENNHLKMLMQDIRNASGSQQAQSLLDLRAENAKLKEALLEIQDYAISPWIVKDRCEQALKGESDV